jgi:hypothetical protein
MKGKRIFTPVKTAMKEEGFLSILTKFLFLILAYILLFLLLFAREGGMDWILVRFPVPKVIRDLTSVDLYLTSVDLYTFWLFSLLLAFKIGRRAGKKIGAVRERNRLGIPF